jgi:hypothetical protein
MLAGKVGMSARHIAAACVVAMAAFCTSSANLVKSVLQEVSSCALLRVRGSSHNFTTADSQQLDCVHVSSEHHSAALHPLCTGRMLQNIDEMHRQQIFAASNAPHLMAAHSRCLEPGSSPVLGSSRNTTSGRPMRAAATLRRRFMPPLHVSK